MAKDLAPRARSQAHGSEGSGEVLLGLGALEGTRRALAAASETLSLKKGFAGQIMLGAVIRLRIYDFLAQCVLQTVPARFNFLPRII